MDLSKAKEDLLPIFEKHLDFNKVDIFVFGSQVDGDTHDKSDIDIGLKSKDEISATSFFDLEEELEMVPYLIDVVDFNKADSEFKDVAEENIIFWNKASGNLLRESSQKYKVSKDKKVVKIQKRYKWLKKAYRNIIYVRDMKERNEVERDGAVQRFEYTIELSWKMFKDLLAEERVYTPSPGKTIKEAFKNDFIKEQVEMEEWIRLIDLRNKSSHIYNENAADKIIDNLEVLSLLVKNLLNVVEFYLESNS